MSHSPFKVLVNDTKTAARRGVLKTRHGEIQTPIFMPVGTQATVKSMMPRDLKEIGTQILLGNTYHLNLRPGSELVARRGGLHQFMGWDGPILTDSGGFQVFSLSKLRRITEEGIHFHSHLDGKKIFLDPARCMEIQKNLGSDIAMVLDVCPPYPCERKEATEANRLTLKWAKMFLELAQGNGFLEARHHVFGIAQGSVYEDLRRECAEGLAEMNFPGYAIGGVSVGEPEEEMLKAVAGSAQYLPKEKPRYVMGVGTPPQLLRMIALGADMFDCVMPTRLARHGTAFTPYGPINLKNEKFKEDESPIVEGMNNYACQHFTRSYIRHLLASGEMLAGTLLSIHNLHFFLDLMRQAREHLEAGDYATWYPKWCEQYESGGEN